MALLMGALEIWPGSQGGGSDMALLKGGGARARALELKGGRAENVGGPLVSADAVSA